jgi:rhodanese-related sulfurtransferase
MEGRTRSAPLLVSLLAALTLGLAACASQPAPAVAPPVSTLPPATQAATAAPATAAPSPAPAGATPLAPASLAALPAQVTAQEAAALRDQGAFVLDVRQASEWVDGHVPGATLIPLDQLPARVGEVPRDRPVVVICRSGNRSAAGRDVLLAAGFPAVTSVEGGVRAWESAGLPIKTGL